MAGVVRMLSRGCLLRQAFPVMTRRSGMATKKNPAYEEMQQYWAKNEQLARPLSPVLTIHSYHLTMVMSIGNRMTAVALQALLVGGSVMMMVVPVNFKTVVDKVRSWDLNPALVYGTKYVVAIPFVYHSLASIRHLIWDTGLGYKGPTIIKGGYAILVATAILSTGLVFGVKPSMM